MLRPVAGREHLIHVCKEGIKQPEITLHDTTAYMQIKGGIVFIKYCPYCGIEIEKDKR